MKKNTLSDKQFSDYYNKKMSEKEIHDFESRITDDDFIADATDGFIDQPDAIYELGNLKGKFLKKNKLNQNFSTKSILIIGIACSFILILGIALFTKSSGKPNQNRSENLTKKNPLKSKTTSSKEKKKEEQKTIILNPKTKESLSPISIIEEQKEIKTYEEELPLEKLEKRNLLSIEINNASLKIQKKKVAFTYIADYKVVDYSNIYTHKALSSNKLPGLPAQYESSNENIKQEADKTIKYEDYLEEALRKLKTSNLNSCIEMLQIILTTYEHDLNADFYLGIAYFNLDQYTEAQKHFEKALTSPYFIFDEESEWYLFLTYKAKGEMNKASKIRRKILDRKGFYYKRAKSEK